MDAVMGTAPSLAALPSLMALVVFSGLSANLILQCGLCLKEIVLDEEPGKKERFKRLGIIYISVIALWLFFSFIRTVLPPGHFEYMLLFPVSCLFIFSLDYLYRRYIMRETGGKADDRGKQIFREAGLTAAMVFIMLNVAGRIIEAAVVSLGFTLGIIIAFLIIGEVRRRSAIEAVPRFIRGKPLAMIIMGLLSLVFWSVAAMFFKVLEG